MTRNVVCEREDCEELHGAARCHRCRGPHVIRCRPPAGSLLIATPDGPAVLTLAPLGAEEIEFAPPWVRHAPTRRDLDVTLALADLCSLL